MGSKIQYSNWIPVCFRFEQFEFEKIISLLEENQFQLEDISFQDSFVKFFILNLFTSSAFNPYEKWYRPKLAKYKQYMDYPVEVTLYKEGLMIMKIKGDFPSKKVEYEAVIEEFGGYLKALWELVTQNFHEHISEILAGKGFGYYSNEFIELEQILNCMITSSYRVLTHVFREIELTVNKRLNDLEDFLLKVYKPGSPAIERPEWKSDLFEISKRVRCLRGFLLYSDFLINQVCANYGIKAARFRSFVSWLSGYLDICERRCNNLEKWV